MQILPLSKLVSVQTWAQHFQRQVYHEQLFYVYCQIWNLLHHFCNVHFLIALYEFYRSMQYLLGLLHDKYLSKRLLIKTFPSQLLPTGFASTLFTITFFLFSIRCWLVIFVVPSGWWTAPSGVGRWLSHGVCFLGNFLLARCFLFLSCGEGMTVGHVLWSVLPVRRGKGLFNSNLCHVTTQSEVAGILSRNIMVCWWRDSKRRVSCWGL